MNVFKWFRDLSFEEPKVVIKEVTKYKVVELDAPRSLSEGNAEIAQSVQTLAGHPGFNHLINKLSYQRAALKTRLEQSRHESLEQVYFLQAGVYWSNWLMTELQRATVKTGGIPKDAFEEELAAFKEIDATLERVGM